MDSIQKLLIVSITPYFLEKDNPWFTQNLQKILNARNSQSFFEDNIIFIEKPDKSPDGHFDGPATISPPARNAASIAAAGGKASLGGDHISFSQLLRKLDEMGYERVFKVSDPGEFSQRGGVIDVFPINFMNAVRLDFLGNEIENIRLLDIKIENEKKSKEVLKKKLKSQKLFSDLKGLKSGDYLVHLDHGVGQFCGIEKFQISQPFTNSYELVNHRYESQAYYVLEYAKGDKLYVPVGLERKLSRYVGFQDPKISRLGSSLWQKTKKKIKEDVEKLAKDLLELYVKKEVASRPAYDTDEELEFQLRAGFEFQETPDQLSVIEDVRKDFKKSKPMDRIVCGDVGFGKTEIAMRTAMMASANSRQTAIVCPTTILANQHFNSFEKRFSAIGGSASGGKNNPLIRVALLSRLQTKTQQKKIIKDIKDGKTDIIIGTHRLLSKDVAFKNLQLLIIDDEQKFGVKQKEKLRQRHPAIDILSLSATPIPRTIYLALSSFKNISLIQTPPSMRQSIKTNVLPYSSKTIKKAINFELKRKGQVYFLHNLVQTIENAEKELKSLCPKAKIGIIHGRMPEKNLIKIMDDFQKGKTNILVATTIIENGLDLPNVNTIIIEDATRLGLSQAHQIRGRIGRSEIKSFAYFMYPAKFCSRPDLEHTCSRSGLEHLPPSIRNRLEALQDAQELGAGYRIAIKDLELRGAGNILGREQSGAINKIGLNLYSQILSEAVEKMKN